MTDYRAEENETDRISDELKRDEAAALAAVRSVANKISESFGGIVTSDYAEYCIREVIDNAQPRTSTEQHADDAASLARG